MTRSTCIFLGLFLSLFFSAASGQNGFRNAEYFILKKTENRISVNSFKDRQIKELQSYKVSDNSICSTNGQDRLAILDTSLNWLRVIDLKTRAVTEKKIPFSLSPKTLLLNNCNLFIGGENRHDGEMLIQFNMASQTWYSLEVPDEIMFPAKAIDDLLMDDGLLLAVDNIIMPKYILYYKLDGSAKAAYLDFRELKANGTYEAIAQGRITDKYICLISSTVSGYTGRAEHITIYDKNNTDRSFAVSIGEREKNYHTFDDVVIAGDKLFIASGAKGLGRIRIRPGYFKNKEGNNDFNHRINASKIRYRRIKEGRIIKLTLVPDAPFVIITIKGQRGKFMQEILKV